AAATAAAALCRSGARIRGRECMSGARGPGIPVHEDAGGILRPDPCVFDVPVEYRVQDVERLAEDDRRRGIAGGVPRRLRDDPLHRAEHQTAVVRGVINEDLWVGLVDGGVV